MRSLVITALCLTLCACNSMGGSSVRSSGGTGMLQVRLTDAPIDLSTVQSVNVTLSDVTVLPEETTNPMGMLIEPGPITLMTHPATFDLLTLTGGATALLASGEVPAGTYSRIHLDISNATLVNKDGSTSPLQIESNKVDVPIQFQVTVGTTSTITLDFNAGASVQVNQTGTGQFILRPVVTPVASSAACFLSGDGPGTSPPGSFVLAAEGGATVRRTSDQLSGEAEPSAVGSYA